jgi:two-component system, sensor histidine kinase ChiS
MLPVLTRKTTRNHALYAELRRGLQSTEARLIGAWVLAGSSLWRLVRHARVLRRLQRQNRRLAELEEMKSAYLRLASHELRTPVGVARGYVDLVHSGELGTISHEAREALSQVSASLRDVDGMVNEMVEIARMQEGRRLLRVETLDLREPVGEAFQRVLPLVGGHDVVVDQPDSPLWVAGDRARLRSAIRNLLENAIKYSPLGGEVRCALSKRNGMAAVVVSDQGLGIEPSELEGLFGRFKRAPQVATGDIPGTGLGLHLAREIAIAHDGDLRVASRPGQGTTFVLSLPLAGDLQPAS